MGGAVFDGAREGRGTGLEGNEESCLEVVCFEMPISTQLHRPRVCEAAAEADAGVGCVKEGIVSIW